MEFVRTAVESLGPWTWWVVGLALLGLEVVVPGMFFLWFGLAALVVAGVGLAAAPLGFANAWTWQVQALAWVALALVFLVLGRRYFHRRGESEDPDLNERTRRYLGRVVTLTEPIVEGSGRIRLEDSVWRVSGPDTPGGTRVEIIGADGPVLRVRPIAERP